MKLYRTWMFKALMWISRWTMWITAPKFLEKPRNTPCGTEGNGWEEKEWGRQAMPF
jgi:hypothetical protein